MAPASSKSSLPVILTLVLAGEAIFFLPFVLPRIFRPTVLEVFHITNTELGQCFSIYGIVALTSYLIGGPLADRFSTSRLMSLALTITAVSGLFLSTLPDLSGLLWLYGFWGASTILLFWAALMRATREWGGPVAQGKAFGFLDGGRGAIAAAFATASVFILDYTIPEGDILAADREQAFRGVILFTSALVLVIAVITLWILPGSKPVKTGASSAFPLKNLGLVIRKPTVWLQAVIILCAYSGYRVTDDISLLGQDMLGYTEIEAASFGGNFLWLRPVGAILAGILADRVSASRMIIAGFVLMLLGSLAIATGWSSLFIPGFTVVAVSSAGLGVYGLRGLYFAVMEEGRIPLALTGSAVGLASVVGYLPDIYMGPLMGYYLDKSPGVRGHQDVMWISVCFAAAGLAATLFFRRLSNKLSG